MTVVVVVALVAGVYIHRHTPLIPQAERQRADKLRLRLSSFHGPASTAVPAEDSQLTEVQTSRAALSALVGTWIGICVTLVTRVVFWGLHAACFSFFLFALSSVIRTPP